MIELRRRGMRSVVMLALALVLNWTRSARAEIFSAEVIGVTDGDTLTVRIGSSRPERIRLAGIDAPEHGQAFGSDSQEHLWTLVSGKRVSLDCSGVVSYERSVCKVLLPNDEDVALDQVKAGMAWHYKQYQAQQTLFDRSVYAAAEDAAREGRLGLWADSPAIQPQDYRHGTRSPLCFDREDHRIACSDLYQGAIRGNARSHIYHWPGCPNYDDISPWNRIDFRAQRRPTRLDIEQPETVHERSAGAIGVRSNA